MALQASEPPPCRGWVTVGEVECRFLARNVEEEALAAVQTIPDMYVEAVSSLVDDANDPAHHFLPVTEHWLKRAINTWRDDGFFSALEGLVSNPGLSGSVVRGVVAQLLALNGWGSFLMTQLPAEVNVSEMMAEFSPVSDWQRSLIRAMDLHPQLPYIAIAKQDDTVDIRSLSQMEPSTILRDKDQQNVTCLQWAPHSNSLLAVGSKVGVLLWNVDPSLPTSRFLTSWVRVETAPGHAPVTTLSWSPRANDIISGSIADTNMMVWDVPMGVATRVRRTEGGGVNLVSVAPSGGRVFVASVGNVMRVWETEKWTCEKWTNASGRCQAACWSPRGDFLLFALHGDHALYYLCFHGDNTAGSVAAVKCADLTPYSYTTVDGQEATMVGGSVQSMAWDPTGERVAIIFTADSPGHKLVTVFRTRLTSMLEILPGGFIRGEEDDMPQLITFQKNCSRGALLATAWLSGRVSFTPLLYSNFPFSTLSPPSLPHHQSHLHQSQQLYSTQTI